MTWRTGRLARAAAVTAPGVACTDVPRGQDPASGIARRPASRPDQRAGPAGCALAGHGEPVADRAPFG